MFKCTMGYHRVGMKMLLTLYINLKFDNTIFSGNKPSSVALYQNHAILVIEMLLRIAHMTGNSMKGIAKEYIPS